MINLIRLLHTAIWLVMTISIFYIGFSVITMTFNPLFFVSVLLVSVEIVVILANSWSCPLTVIARRHSNDTAPNFDIFLPRIIARYNKEIFSVILLIILLIYIINVFT